MFDLQRWPQQLNTSLFLGIAALLGVWLSSSLVLDGLVIPALYQGGMMAQSGFAATSYILFEGFNHLEIILGAVILVLLMILSRTTLQAEPNQNRQLLLAGSLFAIALAYAYWLTPELSGWGLVLENRLQEQATMPEPMVQVQVFYWCLEVFKILGGTWLLTNCLSLGLAQNESI